MGLKLNASKTKAMIYAAPETLSTGFFMICLAFEVSGIPLPYVETAENLGVTLDSKFTWKPQVDAVTKKDRKSVV